MKIKVIFYSMYGHNYKMATAVGEGAQSAGATVELLQVPELVPDAILESSGAKKARDVFKNIPIAKVDDMADADGLIFGTPTRYGNMCAQMRNFLDQAGGLWAKGALENKVASVFTSSNTQHGGQESTILSFHTTLLHLGMIIVGIPYSNPGLMYFDEISGGSPYGASTLAGPDGSRVPSKNELELAQIQGRRVAEITKKLIS